MCHSDCRVRCCRRDPLQCLHPSTGNVLWSTGVNPSYSTPMVMADMVFTISMEIGAISAFNATNGDVLWATSFPNQVSSRHSRVAAVVRWRSHRTKPSGLALLLVVLVSTVW